MKSITLADLRNRFADVSTAIRHRGKLLITMWGVPIASLSPVLSVVIPARDEEGCIASSIEHLHLELSLRGAPHEIVRIFALEAPCPCNNFSQ